MVVEGAEEASFVEVYLILTLSIAVTFSQNIEPLRGGNGNQFIGSYRNIAEAINNYVGVDHPEFYVDPDILGHALRKYKIILSKTIGNGGYGIVQSRDPGGKYKVPEMLHFKLSPVNQGDKIALPLTLTPQLTNVNDLMDSIDNVRIKLLQSATLHSNIRSLSQLFHPRRVAHEMEVNFWLV